MRPYAATIARGEIRITKANFTEIGFMAGATKDIVKTAIYRVIRNITTKLLQKKKFFTLTIPYVGEFVVRRKLVAVKFENILAQETKVILLRNVFEFVKTILTRNYH